MFEITLASWVHICRLLSDNVGEAWAIFFISYKCIVGFAVLKVITGVFLHETFRCASLDDDLMIQQRRRMRDKFKAKMLKFFDKADLGHHGEVTVDEFVAIIADDNINTWLEAMDLRVRDVGAERVFAFLAGSDMRLSREELCSGMSRLRGPAQGLDVITLLQISAPDLELPISKDICRLREYSSECEDTCGMAFTRWGSMGQRVSMATSAAASQASAQPSSYAAAGQASGPASEETLGQMRSVAGELWLVAARLSKETSLCRRWDTALRAPAADTVETVLCGDAEPRTVLGEDANSPRTSQDDEIRRRFHV